MVTTVQFLVILGLLFLATVGEKGARTVANRMRQGGGLTVELGGTTPQRQKPAWW